MKLTIVLLKEINVLMLVIENLSQEPKERIKLEGMVVECRIMKINTDVKKI